MPKPLISALPNLKVRRRYRLESGFAEACLGVVLSSWGLTMACTLLDKQALRRSQCFCIPSPSPPLQCQLDWVGSLPVSPWSTLNMAWLCSILKAPQVKQRGGSGAWTPSFNMWGGGSCPDVGHRSDLTAAAAKQRPPTSSHLVFGIGA